MTTADGLDTLVNVPTNWYDYGFTNVATGVDSTIFGSVKAGSQFISYNAYLQNSGVIGVIPDSNQILVAQLTTKGKISFELNIEIIDSAGNTFKYVADNNILLSGETYCPFLTYPPICGCMNPNYLEYKSSYICGDSSKCKNLFVLGCMDPQACNYDPKANYNLQNLCCYPGLCQDRDISLVCPDLSIKEQAIPIEFKLFPNPAKDFLEIQISSQANQKMQYSIYDSFGRVVLKSNIDNVLGNQVQQVDISNLANGLYLFRLTNEGKNATNLFIKN